MVTPRKKRLLLFNKSFNFISTQTNFSSFLIDNRVKEKIIEQENADSNHKGNAMEIRLSSLAVK